MQGRSPDGHRARDDAGRGLVGDEVTRPRVLAVLKHALPVLQATLEVEDALASFDHCEGDTGLELSELLRKKRRRNASPDDAHVAFDTSGHQATPFCAAPEWSLAALGMCRARSRRDSTGHSPHYCGSKTP